MPRRSQLSIAKRDILSYFDGLPQRVYSDAELTGVLSERRAAWRLAERTSTRDFIAFLEREGKLRARLFRSHAYERETTRYSWGEASPYELACAFNRKGYLSHASAVALHGLTDLIPKKLYLNVEQSPKPSGSGSLTQHRIDFAFSRRQRQSNLSYELDDWTITVLSGKNTGRLGVVQISGSQSEPLQVTNLERTLIDIAVRPAYAGGIFQVLEAYRGAREGVSVNRLVATLRKLAYIYPYHQAIGFLMERAGYDVKRLTLLEELGIEYKFYLTHEIGDPEYDSKWRLFYPKGLEAGSHLDHEVKEKIEALT